MNIAMAVRKKANCLGRRVGALLVKENRIISTGYNGTPEGVENCLDGGCVRCKDKQTYQASVGYDVCICVHAEQNALITGARFGISIEGATAYSTMRPLKKKRSRLQETGLKRFWSPALRPIEVQLSQQRITDGSVSICGNISYRI